MRHMTRRYNEHNQQEGNEVTWSAKHTQTVHGCPYRPLPEGVSSRHSNNIGRDAGNLGGGSGGGRTPGRGLADRVQGGDEGGRSQGGDRRNLDRLGPRPQP